MTQKELEAQAEEMRQMLHSQYAALNQQNAIIHYLLDSMERIALDYDLEEQIDAIVTQIPGVSIQEEKVNPIIIQE